VEKMTKPLPLPAAIEINSILQSEEAKELFKRHPNLELVEGGG
jgi:hypothetical protein